MEMTYHRVNLAGCATQGYKPSDLIERGHANEVWYVPFSPLDFGNPVDWRFYKREQHVVIPMFPFLVPSDPVDALGYAFQLGVNAIHQLGGKPVRRLHLSLGDPVNQVFDDAAGQAKWSFYLGFGVVFE